MRPSLFFTYPADPRNGLSSTVQVPLGYFVQRVSTHRPMQTATIEKEKDGLYDMWLFGPCDDGQNKTPSSC